MEVFAPLTGALTPPSLYFEPVTGSLCDLSGKINENPPSIKLYNLVPEVVICRRIVLSERPMRWAAEKALYSINSV